MAGHVSSTLLMATLGFWVSAVYLTSGDGPPAFAALAAMPAPQNADRPKVTRHHAAHFDALVRHRFAVALAVGVFVGAAAWLACALSPRHDRSPDDAEPPLAKCRYDDDAPLPAHLAHMPAVWPGGAAPPRRPSNWLEGDGP